MVAPTMSFRNNGRVALALLPALAVIGSAMGQSVVLLAAGIVLAVHTVEVVDLAEG